MDITLIFQLVLVAVSVACALLAASSARRAASFDVLADFNALAAAVTKLQQVARSDQMKRVRGAAATPEQPAHPVNYQQTPLTHEQLRAIARGRNGAHQ